MNPSIKAKIFLIFILILSLFLRLFRVSTLPPALFADEVDAGYQAMIFNQNKTDYFGNKFPVHFHSFSDWRTSLYIYSISFFQNITNNSDIAIRLPSVVFSVVSVHLFLEKIQSKIISKTFITFHFFLCPFTIFLQYQ